MFKQREEILAIIIIQKNTLNRARLDNNNFDEKYLESSNKDKSLKT